MIAYKHYSFDLWMTLIKSNPSFKKKRAEYFFNQYNPLNKTLDEVVQVFRHVDLMCNGINEKTGNNIDAEEMYLMVIYHLTNSLQQLQQTDTKALYAGMEQLVFDNMPVLYHESAVEVLAKIKSKKDITLSILSNTAFIKGSTLRIVLAHLQIERYFNFELYSDEVGISKPNAKIFELMLNNIKSVRNEQVLPAEVIHIGDNPVADIAAANAMGMASFQINSNHLLITDLLS